MAGKHQQTVDFEVVDDAAWLQLRVGDIKTRFDAFMAGESTIEELEGFGAAFGLALDEFSADSRRVPGRLDDAARVCIEAARQLLAAAKGKPESIAGDSEKITRALEAIGGHRERFVQALSDSVAARKRKTQSLAA